MGVAAVKPAVLAVEIQQMPKEGAGVALNTRSLETAESPIGAGEVVVAHSSAEVGTRQVTAAENFPSDSRRSSVLAPCEAALLGTMWPLAQQLEQVQIAA